MKNTVVTILILGAIAVETVGAFSVQLEGTCRTHGLSGSSIRNHGSSSAPLWMSTVEAETEDDIATKGLMKRDRYVATNRFAVRKDKQAKFEKRWATRKSRLATLPGFRYFHLMRRVQLKNENTCVYDKGESEETAMENYVSFTIWDKKSDFSAWRKGEAFKEAHGGTSIGAFLSTMVNSALVLRGPPRPAFYDGLLTKSAKPAETPVLVDGWRNVEADGENTLPAECFVGLQKFYVLPERMAAFEKFWSSMDSDVSEADGFVAFSMLRRDGQAKGHGVAEMTSSEPNYVGALIFKDRSSYEKWSKKHDEEATKKAATSNTPSSAAPKMWNKDPEKVFYEGTLVITTDVGA